MSVCHKKVCGLSAERIEDKNSKAAETLDTTERLFSIEQVLKGMPEEEISATRTEKSVPLLKKYWGLLQVAWAPRGAKPYQAVNYSLNNKTKLEGYLANGRIEMTNNRAERAVKPFVIGRKNRLFCHSPGGATASARLYSIIETAKANNLKIYDYPVLFSVICRSIVRSIYFVYCRFIIPLRLF